MFEADRFRPEPIPRDAVLQDVQPRLSEAGSGSSSVVEEHGSETRLPPYTDRTEPSQVSSLIVLGEAVVLYDPPVRVGHSLSAIHSIY